MSDIVDRLKYCAEHGIMDASRDGMAAGYGEAAAEILRLRASLRAANEQAEHFERLWYLRGDKIEKLQADKVDKAAWDINAVLSNQNDKLRKMLEEARNLLHKLTAIIPGNDTAGEEVAILLRAAAAALKEMGDE